MGLCTITYLPSPHQICNDSSQNIIIIEAYPGFFGTQSHLRGLQLGSRGGRGTIPCTKLTAVKQWSLSGKFVAQNYVTLYTRGFPIHAAFLMFCIPHRRRSLGMKLGTVLTPAAQSPPPSVPCWHLTSGVQSPLWSMGVTGHFCIQSTLKWYTDLSSMKDI